MTRNAPLAGRTPPEAMKAGPDPEVGPVQALVELHTRLLDTIEGFDSILDKAEPEFRPVAADFRALHIRQSQTVARMLRAMGHDPDQDGSIFGAVNSAAVAARSWYEKISTNIMDALVQGEKHVLEAYNGAIEKAASPDRERVLRADRAALVALLDLHAGSGR